MTRTSAHALAVPARLDGELLTICHPDEVVDRAGMSLEEKRAVLAAWASDAHAVEGMPSLRQLDSGAVVRIDDVLAALRRLDRLARCGRPSGPKPPSPGRGRARRRPGPWLRRFRRRDDDDGPPPGAPAVGICVTGAAVPLCA
jgi:hypothetical protein